MKKMLLLWLAIIKVIAGKPPLRIIGGRDAENDEYSYIVRLELRLPMSISVNGKPEVNMHLCTGSVLSPSWTVSAAHCFMHFDELLKIMKNLLVIRYGSVLANSSGTYAFSAIDYYIKHHAYKFLDLSRNLHHLRVSNDVVLVHHQPIMMKRYAKLASLDYTTLAGQEVTLAGYGLTNHSDGGFYSTLELQKPLQILTGVVIKCPKILTYPVFCVGRPCGQSATAASGDSGGPVIHLSGVVGILSQGYDINAIMKDQLPVYTVGIITPLSPYVDWISHQVR